MKITVIGQLKDRNTGLGKALNDILVFSQSSTRVDLVNELDITDNRLILLNILKLLKSKTDVFYFTPAGSLLGNIRDSILLLIMLLKRKPIVLHFHNSNFGNVLKRSKLLKRWNRFLYAHIAKIIILGEKQLKMFSDLNIPKEKFVLIRNGIDDNLFILNEELEKKHQQNPIKIIYFSNMIKAKGYELVYDIAKKFDNNADVEFVFSGKFFDEEAEREFLSLVKDSSITYYNGVYGDDKRKLLHGTNIFILPSQLPDETLPISMLEAMAGGNYIFITDVGVISEVVNPETTTFIDRLDAEIIAEKIAKVIPILPRLNYNIDYYRQHFSNKEVQQRILDVIINH